MKEEWTEKLKDRLSGYEENVPEGLWKDIESTLSGRMATAAQRRKSRTVTMIRRTVATVMATAAAAITVFLLIDNGNMQATENSERSENFDIVLSNENIDNTPIKIAINKVTAAFMPDITENARLAYTGTETTETHESTTTDVTVADRTPQTDVPKTTDGKNCHRKGGTLPSGTDRGSRRTGLSGTATPHSGKSNGRISLGLYAGNSTVSTQHTGAQAYPLLYSSPAENMPGGNSEGIQQDLLNIMYAKQYTDIQRTKHHFPIRAGVSVRYATGDRTSIESGVTYTLLRSEMTSGDGKRLEKTRRRLHYIGIPLNISYTVWRNKSFEAYVSAGGEIQKCVSGKDETETVTNGKVEQVETGSTKDSRLQLSLGTAAGIQYNILPTVSIYAEPGINWYPDNGSAVETIYKDKPFNFSVKAGVRITIKN